MSLCILAGGKAITLAVGLFTLSWMHSVEKTEWLENWSVTPAGLVLTQARVKGSGAGMEPGEGARLEEGWWVWQPQLPAQQELRLAASGATVSAWTLCAQGRCQDFGGTQASAIVLRPCG